MKALTAGLVMASLLVPATGHAQTAPAPAEPTQVCDALTLDPPEVVLFGFRCASTAAMAMAFDRGTPPATIASYAICHGEFAATCAMNAGYDIFEECNEDNGIGPALTRNSAAKWCPDAKSYDITVDVAGIPGDNCGYSWFHLHCH